LVPGLGTCNNGSTIRNFGNYLPVNTAHIPVEFHPCRLN